MALPTKLSTIDHIESAMIITYWQVVSIDLVVYAKHFLLNYPTCVASIQTSLHMLNVI